MYQLFLSSYRVTEDLFSETGMLDLDITAMYDVHENHKSHVLVGAGHDVSIRQGSLQL